MVIVITEKIEGGAVNGFFKRLSKGFVFYISNHGPFHRALLIFNYFMTPYLNTRSDKNKISIGSKVPMGIFNFEMVMTVLLGTHERVKKRFRILEYYYVK